MNLHTGERASEMESASTSQTVSSAAAPEGGSHNSSAALLPATPQILIDSSLSSMRLDVADLWAYRELLLFFVWRDIQVRYKQTLIGVLWAIIQPLSTMLLFTLFFNRFAGLSSGQIPYPIFAYTGLLLWTFFSNAVVNSTNSLIANTNLITKVYFPRMLIPAAAVAAGLVDFGVASLVLIGLVLYYGIMPTPSILLLPVFVAVTMLLALAVGMLVSALTVRYRDLRHALPFVIQFWMFASPVIYPSTIVPERWRWVLAANPLTGIIEGFRSALIGRGFEWSAITVSVVLTVCLLLCSLYVFRRMEDTFADLI